MQERHSEPLEIKRVRFLFRKKIMVNSCLFEREVHYCDKIEELLSRIAERLAG